MIAPDDRGFTLGDGLFETVLAEGGELQFTNSLIVLRPVASLDGRPLGRWEGLAARRAEA